MVTVLITGAGGFIGSNLVENQLALGKKVKAFDINLDRLSHLKAESSCELIAGDLRDSTKLKEVIKGTNLVFHLASAHLEVTKSENYYYEINVDAALNLARIAHEARVFGKLKELPANENTACYPEILYEKTKLAGEKTVLQYCHETGFPIVILRPAWVYGPRCPRTLKLFRTINSGKFFMVGDGNNYRHPIYISDMADAFELAGKQDNITGEMFVIASDEPVRLKELIALIMKIICQLIESLFTTLKKEPPFSSRSIKFFTESSRFDIAKAQRSLHFSPKISLREGLAKTYSWFQTNGLL